MKNVIHGGCLCGHIKYEYTGDVGPSSYCHCTDCRKVTGSAFNVSVQLDAKDFRVITGNEPASYTKAADSGREITRMFCPVCGSPLYTKSPDYPEYIWIKAGSLSDPTLVKPGRQAWTDSRVAWSEIDPNIKSRPKG